ncbi:MAG: transcriptional regulator [Deltaproteobacteria bacterium]|nr:transcriptional regulator [Deltaproteobacteria bacterium]
MVDQETAPTEEVADGSADRKEPKVIKRYTNRKLYDTVESRYVTLDEIAQMVKDGAEVKVLDNRTKEDLTTVTLTQIIFEEEKKRSQMPLGMLREIIKNGGDTLTGLYQEKVGTKLQERVSEVKTKAEALRENVEQKLRGVTSLLRRDELNDKAKEVWTAGEKAAEDLRGKVDETVKQALDALASTGAIADWEKLQKRLEAIEKKLEQLGK